MTSTLDISAVRSRFPALARTEHGRTVAYLDGPGGTQVPAEVADAMTDTLRRGVSNLGGGFGASDDAVAITAAAREAVANLLGASPGEVVFGQNMTSLTFAMSRALSAGWSEGDSIVVTALDHDANFTPWVRAATDRGVGVRVAPFDTFDGVLHPEAVIDLLDDSVRLVALCLAANSIGTVVDVASIVRAAHEHGALVYVDAVHAGPHRFIDVAELDCDFLAASAYKFFGPHTGLMYGKAAHLAAIDAYKVRPAPSDPPEKWETGTQSFESLAGVRAAIDYLASLGEGSDRRSRLRSAYKTMSGHERSLGERFLGGIEGMDRVRLYGVPVMDDRRVATFAISVEGHHPDQVAARLAEAAVYVWSGHYYAVNVMDSFGVLDDGGLVRIGFVHYNTPEEVDRTLEVLGSL